MCKHNVLVCSGCGAVIQRTQIHGNISYYPCPSCGAHKLGFPIGGLQKERCVAQLQSVRVANERFALMLKKLE